MWVVGRYEDARRVLADDRRCSTDVHDYAEALRRSGDPVPQSST
jgi:hypothetical protein